MPEPKLPIPDLLVLLHWAEDVRAFLEELADPRQQRTYKSMKAEASKLLKQLADASNHEEMDEGVALEKFRQYFTQPDPPTLPDPPLTPDEAG